MFDIDLFDTPVETIERLQARGVRVICYFSAGSYEGWRPDAEQFPASVLGSEVDGWAGERWLDIRSEKVEELMLSRFDLAYSKGCDAVETDLMDAYQNSPGFPLTAQDQLRYNRFLAKAAHARGLSIGLKNDVEQVAELVSDFQFAVNEECFQYHECEALTPFIDQGKAVFSAEYESVLVNDEDARNALCSKAIDLQLSTSVLPLALDDAFRLSCLD